MAETVVRNGVPVVGFGQVEFTAPAVAASPWPMVLATSVVSAATGWALEEFIGKRRRRKR